MGAKSTAKAPLKAAASKGGGKKALSSKKDIKKKPVAPVKAVAKKGATGGSKLAALAEKAKKAVKALTGKTSEGVASGKTKALAHAKDAAKESASASKKAVKAAVGAMEAEVSKKAPAGAAKGKGKNSAGGSRGAVRAARYYMETGTLLLGNPDGGCREVLCENMASTAGYCRSHYIKNWKKIKRKEQILREGRLNQYLNELIGKYPDKYIEAIRLDLASEKEFAKVIADLDLDENVEDFDGEGDGGDEVIIDNIKASFDEEGDAF